MERASYKYRVTFVVQMKELHSAGYLFLIKREGLITSVRRSESTNET